MSNRYRIINLVFFLIALLGLNYGLTHSLEIPSGNKSLWFHSGLLLLVFGSYWIEYFFTKPSDAVINGLVVFISASTLDNPPFADWWNLLRFYAIGITLVAFLITWHGSPALKGSTSGVLKRIAYQLVIRLGAAKVIFSLTFFLSVISYYGMASSESKWMLGFWVFVIVLREMQLEILGRVIVNLFTENDAKVIGEVSYFKQPGLAKFKLANGAACPKGSIVAFTRSGIMDEQDPVAFITTNNISPDETECEAIVIDSAFKDSSINSHSTVVKVEKDSPTLSERLSRNQIFKKIDSLIGYATKSTDIGTLRFDLIRRPNIEEGHLVGIEVEKNKEVLFQAVNGQHIEEIFLGNSERRFTLGTAEQIGVWNDTKQCFETYSWVVPENSPVFHVTPEREVKKRHEKGSFEVGRVPNSNFPANINLTDLTLYHSAILGVTGSGKSYLAYQVIESLAEMGVHVLCLDVTGDHKRHLRNCVQIKTLSHVEPFLNSAENKIGIIEFHDERTHPIRATKLISESAYNWCKKNRRDDEIKNPIPKAVIVLEEAHTLIPEWNFNPEKDMQNSVNQISQIVLQARKYGLGFMVISQRTANVTKSILNQCNTVFSFQAYDETGFDFLKNYMGDQYVRALPNLKARHGILVGKASLSDRPLIVRFNDQERQLNDSIADFVPPDQTI